MQVNFTEAGVIGKETSVRRRESKFGNGEGICREEKSKTSPIASITSIPRWTYRKEPPQSPSSLVRIQFVVTNVEHVVLIPPIILLSKSKGANLEAGQQVNMVHKYLNGLYM